MSLAHFSDNEMRPDANHNNPSIHTLYIVSSCLPGLNGGGSCDNRIR